MIPMNSTPVYVRDTLPDGVAVSVGPDGISIYFQKKWRKLPIEGARHLLGEIPINHGLYVAQDMIRVLNAIHPPKDTTP